MNKKIILLPFLILNTSIYADSFCHDINKIIAAKATHFESIKDKTKPSIILDGNEFWHPKINLTGHCLIGLKLFSVQYFCQISGDDKANRINKSTSLFKKINQCVQGEMSAEGFAFFIKKNNNHVATLMVERNDRYVELSF